jgi:myo-inositol-1(or 4)-monophosphatase
LLARGGTEGLVAFYPAAYERHAGELLAAESGAAVTTLSSPTDSSHAVDADDGTERDALSVAAGDEATVADLLEALAL